MIGIEKVNQLCRLTIILMVIISVVISVIIIVIFTRAKAAEELARAQKAAEEGMRKASLSLQVKIMRQIYEECHHVTLWGTPRLLEHSWMLWSLLFWIRYSIELFKFRDWIKMATTPLWVQALHWELTKDVAGERYFGIISRIQRARIITGERWHQRDCCRLQGINSIEPFEIHPTSFIQSFSFPTVYVFCPTFNEYVFSPYAFFPASAFGGSRVTDGRSCDSKIFSTIDQ